MPRSSALANGSREKEINGILRLYKKAQYGSAEIRVLKLLRQCPEFGLGWKVKGLVLQALGRLDESLQAKIKAVELLPHDWEAHFNLGYAYQLQGAPAKAVESYSKGLTINPHHADAYNNMANALKQLGQLKDAELICKQALAIQPNMANAHQNLGNIYHAQDKWLQAVGSYHESLKLRPDWAEAHSNLAISLQYLGLTPESAHHFRKALELRPDWDAAHSNLLFSLSHDVMLDAQAIFAEHLAFGERFEAPLRPSWRPHENSKDPHRILKIGIVSGDLYHHAIANFLEPVLKHLSRSKFLSLHAYYTNTINDNVTIRLRGYFPHWHAIAHLSAANLADQIRSDGIDILIDLSGHTAHNRLLAFARKPAPIQASWMGYPGTTGLQAMDYHFCDHFWIPPQLGWQFTEKSVLLPVSAIFLPSEHAPAINVLPAKEKGYITFASFNRPNKINDSVIALWSMLLRGLPNSRMLLGSISPDRQHALIECFSRQGIEPDRLIFYPRLSMQDYLGLHHQIDICLDTFPYSGGTTIHHAAWMGVPTLTLAGETPTSRAGAAEMHFWGLDDFIASSIEEFINKGLFWAENLTSLADIRANMRARLEASPLGQPAVYAASLEAAFRAIWQRWCNDLPAALIDTLHGDESSAALSVENTQSPIETS